MGELEIGCCGFPVARARYYRLFSSVEIQQSFYQLPRQETVEGWRREAPPGFEFTLKAWQLLTHEASSPTYRRLREPLTERQRRQVGSFRWNAVTREAWERTLELARILQARWVIFQCPARFQETPENRKRMGEFFGRIERSHLTCGWEPRGSWKPQTVEELCRELDLIHVVDPFQARPVTSGRAYFRLHGITGYQHRFQPEELKRLKELCAGFDTVHVFFNNRWMLDDALAFRRSFSL